MKRRIRLRGINGDVEGKIWESESVLPRRPARHAGDRPRRQLRQPPPRRDPLHRQRLARPRPRQHQRHLLNGTRLGPGEWPAQAARHRPLRQRHLGRRPARGRPRGRRRLDARRTTCWSRPSPATAWEDAFNGLAFDRNRSPRPGEQLLALLAAGHHLVHLESEEDLLHSILNDAVSTLDAQRGAIVLADGADRAAATARPGHRPQPDSAAGTGFSQSLAQRCFSAANRSCAAASRKIRSWPAPAASPRGPWPRCCASCCARRASGSACCTSTAAAAEAVHQGRPAPGRRPGRQRLRRHRERPAAPEAARAVPRHDHHAGPGGRAARRVHRRPHRPRHRVLAAAGRAAGPVRRKT